MKQYDMIIFDLDGTLSNSEEGITKSMQYALDKMGIKEPDLKKLKHFIGPPLIDELLKTYDFTEEMAGNCVTYYRERYVPTGIYETAIYDGTKEMLRQLKDSGKTIAMATSKPQPMAEEVLRYLKIDQYFDSVMGADVHGPKQSKQAVLEALFDTLDVEDKRLAVMVGDTCFDVEGAAAVGIDCIGVSYGFGKKEDMIAMGAVAVADNTKELTELILKEQNE